ncbi:glycerophosphodiester phosphodiesterase family protein [Pontibacterium sp.]|jgi:glycerophosphoryl diester phosphodiesterase|uniref:glycerophosphodiester phosphodiesterase family protein n=1 Tax=Pontibacterium sp. TaxID=2036026 RepID=UPI00356A3296
MRATQLKKRLVAHRGFQSRYPENTLLALQQAVDAGVERLEFDIQLTADHRPVLFHDLDLRRVCGEHHKITELTRSQLNAFSASEPGRLGDLFVGEAIPDLEAVIEWATLYPSLSLFVEIKEESIDYFGIEAVLDAVLPVLRPLETRATLISFHASLLAAARDRWGSIGLVTRRWPPTKETLSQLHPDILFVNKRRVRHRQHLDQLGIPVVVYEVDTVHRATHWLKRGAAYLETHRCGDLLTEWSGHYG